MSLFYYKEFFSQQKKMTVNISAEKECFSFTEKKGEQAVTQLDSDTEQGEHKSI